MDKNHKPCPKCGEPMRRQSRLCLRCSRQDPAYRQRMSEAKKGQPSYKRTPANRAKMSRAKMGNPSKTGLKDSQETRQKKRDAWTPERREAARERGLKNAADPEWRRMIAESVSGPKNPMWEDGRAQIPYAPGWGRVNRRLVRKRAQNRCEKCGRFVRLHTHHKDGSKENHALDNLQALCPRCHKKAHAELRQKRKNLQG